ncbi:MAG: tetratricopeptide repeat protein [Gammaproteobacteria bacterium]|nr:tetratricopeptide repeat protein [Gammaproteobacteria bacterium]
MQKPAQSSLETLAEVEIPAEAQRQYGEAVAQLETGEFAVAAAKFEIFVQRYPDYAAAYINLAIIHARQERDDEALLMLSRALEIDSTNPVALNQLALLKRRSGDFGAAESAWRKAIDANPDYLYAWYNLGVLYDLYLQDLPAALEHYQAYQVLNGMADSDAIVARWIADLKNRIGDPPQTAQVTEF